MLYGSTIINKITIIRKPITNIFNMIIKPFNKTVYDKYFHLSLIINDKIIIEKNEVINVALYDKNKIEKDIQFLEIKEFQPNITINELLENTKQLMGLNKYYSYSGLMNNCQDFISAILKSNNIINENALKFIKQDVLYIRKNWQTIHNIMNMTTNIAAAYSNLRN